MLNPILHVCWWALIAVTILQVIAVVQVRGNGYILPMFNTLVLGFIVGFYVNNRLLNKVIASWKETSDSWKETADGWKRLFERCKTNLDIRIQCSDGWRDLALTYAPESVRERILNIEAEAIEKALKLN